MTDSCKASQHPLAPPVIVQEGADVASLQRLLVSGWFQAPVRLIVANEREDGNEAGPVRGCGVCVAGQMAGADVDGGDGSMQDIIEPISK